MNLFKGKTPEEIREAEKIKLEKLRERRLKAQAKAEFASEQMKERAMLDDAEEIKAAAAKQRFESFSKRLGATFK